METAAKIIDVHDDVGRSNRENREDAKELVSVSALLARIQKDSVLSYFRGARYLSR